MKNLLTFALFCCVSVYFIACKSNDALSPATPTPDATACTLKKIVYTNHASLLAIEFTYNATKRLTKVTKTTLKSADSQIDSLEYNAKGQLFKIYTMAANTKKVSSVILIEYDANSKPITINRSNSDYKDNFIYDQNNQTTKIESSYKLPYTSETDTYTFEYDKKGNASKLMLNVVAIIPGFGNINHSYFIYENILIDEKNNMSNTSPDLAAYSFIKGDPERLSMKNNPLQMRIANKVDVTYEPTGSKATVNYQIHSHKYVYNDNGLPIKDTDDVSDSGSNITLKTVVAEMVYECK